MSQGCTQGKRTFFCGGTILCIHNPDTGVYSRAWGRQEVPSEDARADNPLQRL
ncbi:TPA: hypothetical protein J1F49_000496 [Escherichia coli]|nr:hypothetical protein [Escherichia coli]EFM9859114.1 hypothetical protein [Escherichia coli]EIM6063667.1 hypothetical protein [Escherichia coli]EKG7180676.1 hypothetical protein [Escherichia coli]EKM0584251.1 hypothetical protein [Escherichia coli]